MWWFSKNAQGELAAPVNVREQSESQLVELMPDLTETIEGPRAPIKIWLPEIVARTVKYLAGEAGESQSAWLRDLLVTYTYGRAAMKALEIRERQLLHEQPMFSRKMVDRTQGRWIYLVPQLGKNTVAFKLWASEQMKTDLSVLAEHAGTQLSAFVREIIIADLLGHATLPERPQVSDPVSPAAVAWERGEEVLVAEVSESDYDGLGDAERVWRETP